ncbi:PIG-L family deacetylase [Paenibacillus sp. N1-5-1-14]|uniref:PIG-L family deacetylase n=1 Tax=Paenibacillus radicibacter TaxID=2972488 RepID=UPI0021597F9A|nr:PIG-L family deacetylase [Paenibacillus radicibacter]MCR8643552.1 PIG-L family deacetylase [Paenibacillus radicibacter]
MTARKILLVLAHPDDESFICGGTLAKYAKEGVEISLVCATRGEMGRRVGNPPTLNRETIAIAREVELKEACSVLGISRLQFLDVLDKTVEFEDPYVMEVRIAAIIEDLKPDVVLTFHEVLGGHPDHCAIGKFCKAGFERIVRRGKLDKPMHLYYISYGDSMKQPEKYGIDPSQVTAIDTTSGRYNKLLAFRAHRSQSEIIEWVWKPDKEALGHISRMEYFIHGDNTPKPQDSLFSH